MKGPAGDGPTGYGSVGRPARRTRADIVAAGLAIAEADGLDAVTMRRVANELGTGAASLYRHVATRDDLVDLMVEECLRQYEPPGLTEDALGDAVSGLMHRLRFTREHPWLVEAFEMRPAFGPQRLRLIEIDLERLAGHPAPGPVKLEALAVLGGMVHTQARHERSGGALDPEVERAQVDRLHRTVTDGGYPHLADALAAAPTTPGESSDTRFARVLARTLDGLLTDGPSDSP